MLLNTLNSLHIGRHVAFYSLICISGTSQYICVTEQEERGTTPSPFVTVTPDHVLYLAERQTVYQQAKRLVKSCDDKGLASPRNETFLSVHHFQSSSGATNNCKGCLHYE